ncbi:hypothetical protein D3C86_2148720 [compost metagenome]
MYQLVRAIHHRQELLDSKVEAMAMNVHKLQGEFVGFREETRREFSRYDRHLRAVESDLDRTIERVEMLEEPRN